MAVLPDPFSIFPKGVWARDYKHATVGQNNLAMMYLVTLLETSAECCMFSHEGRSEPGCS